MNYSSPTSEADIDHRFSYHAPTATRALAHADTRDACLELAAILDADLPPGREKSLAITKLEEAMFWANAAIARAPNE